MSGWLGVGMRLTPPSRLALQAVGDSARKATSSLCLAIESLDSRGLVANKTA